MSEKPIVTLFMLASVALPVAAWLVRLVLVANSTAAISVLTAEKNAGKLYVAG